MQLAAMFDALDLTGHSILIVDNEEDAFLVTLQASIEKLGAQCLVASGARWAAEILERFRFSAVVISADLRLAKPYDLPIIVYRGRMLSEVHIIIRELVAALGG
jgi:ActR/RegA family two-component response regulator